MEKRKVRKAISIWLSDDEYANVIELKKLSGCDSNSAVLRLGLKHLEAIIK